MSIENVATSNEPKFISKISVGSLGLKGGVAIGSKKPIPLCVIMGKASGTKVVENKQTGESHIALTGEFEATIIYGDDRGLRYRSGILYLIKGLHEALSAAANKLMNEQDTIDFAVQINAVSATNAAGYTYEGVQLYKPESAPDPLDELRAKLPGLAALLNAPKANAELPAPAKEEAKAEAKASGKK